jgi:hypothetical protein
VEIENFIEAANEKTGREKKKRITTFALGPAEQGEKKTARNLLIINFPTSEHFLASRASAFCRSVMTRRRIEMPRGEATAWVKSGQKAVLGFYEL